MMPREEARSPGYFPGRFSAEAADGARSNIAATRGLGVLPGDQLALSSRSNDRWNLSMVWRHDELFLFSTSLPGTPQPFARVDRIDPVSLETLQSSAELANGGHIWEGGCLVHRNGDIYVVSGCFLHRLNAELAVVASMEMSTARPYDSLLSMDDGRLITKDVSAVGTTSRLCVVDADDLSTVMELPVPESTLGKCCADGDDIYVPGEHSIFRFRYRRSKLSRDTGWTGRYRTANNGYGHCSDLTVGGGYLWAHDNADTYEIRDLLRYEPVGSAVAGVGFHQSFDTPCRLHRISTKDASDHVMVAPFDLFAGWPSASPTFVAEHLIVLTFDSLNGGLAAFDVADDGSLRERWQRPIRTRWQPLVFADTAEVVVDDVHLFDDANIVVLDLFTGRDKARLRSGTPLPSDGRATPGPARDVVYLSSSAIFRMSVVPGPGWAAPAFGTAHPLPPPDR